MIRSFVLLVERSMVEAVIVEGNVVASTGFHQNNPKSKGNDQYAGGGNSTNYKEENFSNL